MTTPFAVTKFKTEYPNGRETEWVEIAPIGESFDRCRTWHRIKDVRPPANLDRDSPSAQAMLARWSVIEPAYNAWKAGMDVPEGGTPLAAWSGVTPEQTEVLVRMGIKTVEDVAAMTEGAVKRLPWPNARKTPELAKAFLDSRVGSAQAEELALMRERVAAMEEMLAEQVEAKRGPGRPRKEVEAA